MSVARPVSMERHDDRVALTGLESALLAMTDLRVTRCVGALYRAGVRARAPSCAWLPSPSETPAPPAENPCRSGEEVALALEVGHRDRLEMEVGEAPRRPRGLFVWLIAYLLPTALEETHGIRS